MGAEGATVRKDQWGGALPGDAVSVGSMGGAAS